MTRCPDHNVMIPGQVYNTTQQPRRHNYQMGNTERISIQAPEVNAHHRGQAHSALRAEGGLLCNPLHEPLKPYSGDQAHDLDTNPAQLKFVTG